MKKNIPNPIWLFILFFILTFIVGIIIFSCDFANNPKENILINVEADSSLTHFSKAKIMMIDSLAKDTVILFEAKLNFLHELKNIPAPKYHGQKVTIVIQGFNNDILFYEEKRDFDGAKNSVTGIKISLDSLKSKPTDSVPIKPIDSVISKPIVLPVLNKKPYFLNPSGRKKFDISIRDTVVFFDSAMDDDGNLAELSFDFNGDGRFDSVITLAAKSIKVNYLHVYNDSGKFNTIIRAKDDSGSFVLDTIEVQAEQDIPTVNPGMKSTQRPGPVSLSGSYLQKFGTIVMFKWDFDGDGKYDDSSSTTSLMTYNYVNENAYLAKFYVRDDDGNIATATREIVISSTQKIVNSKPTISTFTHVFLISIKDTVNLNISASDEDGKIVQYTWDFNADGISDSTITTNLKGVSILFSKVFQDSGAYKLILKVKDDSGATVSDTAIITVLLDPPKANAGKDTSVITGTTILLHAESSDGLGKVVKREWKIGSGSFTIISKDDTTFIAGPAGNLTCTLRVTDDDGNQTLDDKVITITPPIPNVPPQITSLTIDRTTCTIGDTVTLTAHGKDTDGNISQYFWDYDGDGKYDDSAYVSLSNLDMLKAHRFIKAGKYSIYLKIKDDKGATLEQSVNLDVQASPPLVTPGIDTTVYAGTPIKLHAKGSDRYNQSVKLEWKGPEGIYKPVWNLDTIITAPTMATAQIYFLRATDAFGQITEKSITVTVIMATIAIHLSIDGRDSLFENIPISVGGKVTYMLDTVKLRKYSFRKWSVISGQVQISDSTTRQTDLTLNGYSASIKADMVLKRVLVISKYGYFRHASIQPGIDLILKLALDNNFQADFIDSTTNLGSDWFRKYQTVIFNQTTSVGTTFDTISKVQFQYYYRNGGGLVAIHGAIDDNSTWGDYEDILGGKQISHSSGLRSISIDDEAIGNSLTSGLPQNYDLNTEWTRVNSTVRSTTGTTILLSIQDSLLTGTPTGKYPISWIRNYAGGRLFYTTLGHDAPIF